VGFPEIPAPIEREGLMKRYQPALDESLESLEPGESVLLEGIASVGNCQGYYLITDRGVHYCDSKKVGLFKTTYIARFFPRSEMTRATVERIAGPVSAYLDIYDHDGELALVMKFDNPWERASCIEQAEAVGRALALE